MPIEYLKEYDSHVMIAGLRDVKIRAPEVLLRQLRTSATGVEAQVFDARGIAGRDHLRFAVINALKSWAQGRQVTDSLAVEVLLYASAQRQIKNAIASLGVSPESRNLAVVAIAKDRHALERLEADLPSLSNGRPDESILEEGDTEAIRRTFGITDDQVRALLRRDVTQREALLRLVIEKMALLSVQV